MRVVALVESVDHVCCRYRLAAFAPALAAAGVAFDLRPLPKTVFARLCEYRNCRDADLVVVQRKLLPRVEVAVLRHFARRLAFDFDDAVWLRDSYSPKGFENARRARRFRAIVSRCDFVLAGNPYLAAEANRFAKPGAVVHLPTCVEPRAYPLAKHERPAGAVQLVWVGSRSTLNGLERIRPILDAVGKAVPGARLKMICDRFLKFDHLPVDEVPWTEASEASEIAAADVGSGWVPDDPWSRGKCALKLLQYQAAGLPVIANPVGVQADIVRRGETGFPAETAEEWIHAVRELAENPALRRQLGAAGRKQVETRFSVDVGARIWLDLLASCDPRPRVPDPGRTC